MRKGWFDVHFALMAKVFRLRAQDSRSGRERQWG
jgi:hypothetical protein